jgi:hypothetical protein
MSRSRSNCSAAARPWRSIAGALSRAGWTAPFPAVRSLQYNRKTRLLLGFSIVQPFCSDRRLALADATLWTGIIPASVIRIAACVNLAAAAVALIQVDCR